MQKKVSIIFMAVLLVALSAGLSFAAAPYGGYGNGYVDGMVTGTTNGAATNVFVNPQGTGDALIYGYYNARGNMGNLFTLTNTATYGVRARIRFKEAKYSCEVIDFDVCLSAKDVWTAFILNNNGVANLNVIDADTAIDTASPRGAISGLLPSLFPNGIDFRYGSAVSCSDPSGKAITLTPDDTLEGYFIVIAENKLAEESAASGTCGVKGTNGAVKTLSDDLTAGSVDNVLFGNDYGISLTDGKTYAYNATAIGDFSNTVFITDPIAETPDIQSGDELLPALNFVLTKNTVFGSYYDLGAGTEVIVNFPTKKATVVSGADNDIFDDSSVLITAYDTAENSKTTVCQLSPCPPSQTTQLPNEVNVISINGSAIFNSVVEVPITIDYPFGWLSIDLVNALTGTPAGPLAHQSTAGGLYSHGLPAIGYVASDISASGWNWMLPLAYSNTVDAVNAEPR